MWFLSVQGKDRYCHGDMWKRLAPCLCRESSLGNARDMMSLVLFPVLGTKNGMGISLCMSGSIYVEICTIRKCLTLLVAQNSRVWQCMSIGLQKLFQIFPDMKTAPDLEFQCCMRFFIYRFTLWFLRCIPWGTHSQGSWVLSDGLILRRGTRESALRRQHPLRSMQASSWSLPLSLHLNRRM